MGTNALLLYFSGTGNTRSVAEEIRAALRRRGVAVEMHSLEEPLSSLSPDYDLLVVGFPKYYEYPVLSVLEALRVLLPRRETEIPTLAFCTQAGPLPTDFSALEKLLRAKNHRLTVSKSFPFANNMMIFRSFHLTDPQEVAGHEAAIRAQIPPLLDTFLSGGTEREHVKKWEGPLYHLVAVLCTKWMPVFGMKYSASDSCIGCGVCARDCPRKNIRLVNGRPSFGRDCIFCMRCINACPVNSILYHHKQCPQYLCPARKPED